MDKKKLLILSVAFMGVLFAFFGMFLPIIRMPQGDYDTTYQVFSATLTTIQTESPELFPIGLVRAFYIIGTVLSVAGLGLVVVLELELFKVPDAVKLIGSLAIAGALVLVAILNIIFGSCYVSAIAADVPSVDVLAGGAAVISVLGPVFVAGANAFNGITALMSKKK